ncbi:unnamed protein product [Adineta ricciae]|uniref:Sodium-dependent glucose transporter 1-like protein n=1 Tax=Adineta ricciae TaxID=249248 RepID=A0A815REK4_ADIRI|nr:unnamed protein product [Adineta ricciae]CAF1476008.1 unnamed protein product [Adineta ricciae]
MSNESGLKLYTSHPWELIKTIYLVLTWIVLGMHLEIVGPTLQILAGQTNVDTTGISTILVIRGAGYMFGNIIGALTQKIAKKYPEFLLTGSFLVAAIVVFFTPYIHNIYLLSTISFFQGISQGITDLGGTSLMLTMWADNVAAPLNVVHLGYGFGAVFANLLVRPFLSENGQSNIRIPYSIVAIICFLITIGHLVFAIREHQIKKKALKDRPVEYSSVSTTKETIVEKEISSYSPRSCGNGYFGYGLSMSIIWIFYMFFLSGNDQTFGKFFFAYIQKSKLSTSSGDAVIFMIVYWLSYSVGRLICAIIVVFVPVHISLCVLWIFGFLLAITWFIFVWLIGLTSTNLLILGAFTGLVFSPTFPLSFAFINQRLNVNPLLVGLLLCGASSGAMVFQKIGGYVLDEQPNHFPTILITCVILAIICFIMALIISSIHQRKHPIKQKDNPIRNEQNKQIESYVDQQL